MCHHTRRHNEQVQFERFQNQKAHSSELSPVWAAKQLVYLDESACNERTMDHNYGWSEVGTPYVMVTSAKRSEKWSILPLYSMEGFIQWEIIQGLYNAEMFKNFVRERVLPLMNSFPGPRSVLFMDIAAIRRTDV